MTKSEITFIKSKIDEFRKYANEDFISARRESDPHEKEHLDFQSRLNDCAANTLENLLGELLA